MTVPIRSGLSDLVVCGGQVMYQKQRNANVVLSPLSRRRMERFVASGYGGFNCYDDNNNNKDLSDGKKLNVSAHGTLNANCTRQKCGRDVFPTYTFFLRTGSTSSCGQHGRAVNSGATISLLGVHGELCLELSLMFRFSNPQVADWSVDRVVSWVADNKFPAEVAQNVKTAAVDGDLLLQLSDASLKQDLQLKNGIHRKRFLRELIALKKKADYSAQDCNGVQDFLEQSVGPDYKIYTYNLIKADLTPALMRTLAPVDLNDMLKEAGVDSSIHRRKIVDAVANGDASPADNSNNEINSLGSSFSEGLSSADAVGPASVYVSFNKETSAELASLVEIQLTLRGFSVCTRDSSHSSSSAICNIKECRNFVVVLSSGSLSACYGDEKGKNILHREVAAALSAGKNVIPVTDGYDFFDVDRLPADMRALASFNSVRWAHDYQDACIDKIERFLVGVDGYSSGGSTSRAGSLGRLAAARSRHSSGGTRSSRSPTPANPLQSLFVRNIHRKRASSSEGITFSASPK